MLYVLGGAARAGKTAAAKRFMAKTGVPYFPLDCLMMGFARGLPAYGIDPEEDELRVADQMWPMVRGMAMTLIEDQVEYLFEGVQVRPRHVAELSTRMPGCVRACFLGFAEIDSQVKFRQMRRFGGGSDDWLRDVDDEALLNEIDRLKELSARLRDECRRHGIPYLEVSTDLEETVQNAVRTLTG